ncbi:hypothetical protein BMS3Bbin06_02062 [bacterium BMS3Bbin06]|nr:hypothetical protein BMS3Abin08_00701 [bacterium BMS3Abin08]GBE35521.1 hypothetical protein BMS3Bbin06_02062 [bacterium BMS3Bbin06]
MAVRYNDIEFSLILVPTSSRDSEAIFHLTIQMRLMKNWKPFKPNTIVPSGI